MEAFLSRLEMDRYLPALRELGLERFSDFEEIEDQDLDDMGMSTLKKRKLRRALQEDADENGITPHRLRFQGDVEKGQTGGNSHNDGSCTSIWWYFIGTMFTQIGQSSMLILAPLIAIHITGSTAIGAAAGTAAAGCAALGQLIFIPLLIRFDLRTLLLITMIWKVFMLILLVYFYQHSEEYHGTTKHWVSGFVFSLCMADSIPRGGIDSLRNVIPMIYHGSDQEALSNFYAKFQFAYNIAMCLGPALLGFSLQYNRFAATYMVLVVYIVALGCFWFMPTVSYDERVAKPEKKEKKVKVGFWDMCSGSFSKLKHPLVLVPFVGGLNVQGQRLKGIYATIFAKGLLNEPTGHTAGYIVSAQGAGGIFGAMVAARFAASCATQWWFLFGISVVVLRTWGWLGSIATLDAGGTSNEAAFSFICITFLYGFANMITVNVMVSLLNARAQSVEIMGLSRFLVRMSGVFTKMGVTFIVGKYELAAALSGGRTDYRAMFTTMSLCITVLFCLPAFLCFLHMCMFSGVGFEGNYPPIDGGEHEALNNEGAGKEGIELEDASKPTNYGATDDTSKK